MNSSSHHHSSHSSSFDDDLPFKPNINIEIDHLSVTGHVVFAGRDGQVNVQTGGDVAQHTNQTITAGGVETTPQELDLMMNCIQNVAETIKGDSMNKESKEAAMHDLQTVEEQLTTEKKPNPRILMRAAKSLLRFSPALTAAALTLFDQPLVGAILASFGEVAVNFHEVVRRHSAAKKI